MEKGKLLIISGPSGVGKSTVVTLLRQRNPEIYYSISATTRAPRPEDKDGVTYWFKTVPEFKAMIEAGEFYEYAEYAGNYYGTPSGPVKEQLAQGHDVILDIDVQGALQLRQRIPDAVHAFIVAPHFADIEARLRGRGDTDEETIARRVKQARWEYSQAMKYDYIVLNDVPMNAVHEIESILTAARIAPENRQHLLKTEEE